MTDYESLKFKSIKLKTQVAQHLQTARDTKAQYLEMKEKLTNEQNSLMVQDNAIDVLKEIIDRMSQQHVERIVELLTYALQTIFYDKNYSVEVLLGDKRNAKTAELQLVEKTEDEVIRSPFDDGIGGGIVAIVGFVLQVYYIGALGLSPVVFIDEGFSQVSSQYIEPLMQFINELAEAKGFIFVLVTHDVRLMNKAVRTYEVVDGVYKLVEGRQNGSTEIKEAKD